MNTEYRTAFRPFYFRHRHIWFEMRNNMCPIDRLKIELRMRHDSSQSGIWRIYGEELEDLGTVKGRYCDIVDYSLTLPAFVGYGSGGKIELLKIKTINPEDIKRKLDLQNEQKRLKALLEEVDKKLQDS